MSDETRVDPVQALALEVGKLRADVEVFKGHVVRLQSVIDKSIGVIARGAEQAEVRERLGLVESVVQARLGGITDAKATGGT